MKNQMLRLLSMIVLILLSSGCSNTDEMEFLEIELGSYSFGPILSIEANETLEFEYQGEMLRIPYYAEGHGQGIVNEFSWFALVNGIPQPTQLENLNGEIISEMAYMHEFALEFGERREFYVVFEPVSGVEGETVGFIGGTLLQPSFIPTDILEPEFHIFHNLVATLPADLHINSKPNNSYKVYDNVILTDISPFIWTQLEESFEGADVQSIVRNTPFIGLFPNDEQIQISYEGIINTSGRNAIVNLFALGGQEVTNRITLFVNHHPVQINGADLVEVEMQNGKMSIIELEVNLKNIDLQHFNSIYAIMMTTGNDYHEQDIFKTRTLLLVNEADLDE